jgi:D-sedoheptulose 7-phosphate isomerase
MSDGKYYTGKGSLVPNSAAIASSFFDRVRHCLKSTEVCPSDLWLVHDGTVDDAIAKLKMSLRANHKRGGKVIFIGNGGSAAIASHMAVDYTKNGGIRAVALNDAPTLTCLANDFGYENVFAKQLEYHATPKDVVVIVSSSGKSKNILRAAEYCYEPKLQCKVVTLSGMNPNNHLRRFGHLNFYVPSSDYGLVELSHLCILHSVVSLCA